LKKSSGKDVALLFSGGLDSTYLLYKNLKDGNRVTPIFVEIKNNGDKVALEKNRIELIYKVLKREFNHLLRPIHYSLVLNVEAREDSLYFKQMPIWMLALLYSQECGSEIQIGYTTNDDAIPYLDDIRKIYRSYEAISDKLIPITFPLLKIPKFQMFKELPYALQSLIVSCEEPRITNINVKDGEDVIIEYEPCCECAACRHIIAGNYYNTFEFPKYYEEKMHNLRISKLIGEGYKIIDSKGVDIHEKLDTEWKQLLEKQNKPQWIQATLDLDFDMIYDHNLRDKNRLKDVLVGKSGDDYFDLAAPEKEFEVKLVKALRNGYKHK